MVLVTKPMFWDMGNHLRPFSEAPDRPEGQELGGGAVGGQEVQIIDENMHQSYNFKAVSLMKKRITVFKVSNDFHTQKHRV